MIVGWEGLRLGRVVDEVLVEVEVFDVVVGWVVVFEEFVFGIGLLRCWLEFLKGLYFLGCGV